MLFASLRDVAGCDQIDVELPDRSSIEDLVAAIAVQQPGLADRLPSTRVAMNERFSAADEVIDAGAELALIPPVSGG